MGCLNRSMTLQAFGGGEFALRLVSHQRVAPLYRWSRSHTHITHTMVSSLPTAPWTHTSQGDDECCNVLERYVYHHLVTLTKSCKSCQINKRRSQKYGHLPSKTVYTIPWECICVDLIGPYTLKGKDNLQIDFMALTMIDPASSWFKIAELPIVEQLRWQTVNGKELLIADEIFDKTLESIAKLKKKTWLCRYPWCCHLIYNNGSEFKLHFEYLCESYGIKRKPTTVKNPRANGILERVHQVLGQMLCTADLDMADSVTPDDINVFLDNAAWSALPITRYLKSPQVQPFSDKTCSVTFRLWLTGTKLENKGNHWPIVAISKRTLHELTMITRLEIKY